MMGFIIKNRLVLDILLVIGYGLLFIVYCLLFIVIFYYSGIRYQNGFILALYIKA